MAGPLQSTMFNGVTPFYNGVITSSLRFNGSNSRLESPTFGGDEGDTWTWSAWVKFTNQVADKRGTLFGVAGNNASLYFDSSGQSFLSLNDDGDVVRTTTRVLRDPASWYHIVLNGNGTLNKLWINGILTTFNTNANIGKINEAVVHYIGYSINSNYYFNGLIADVNFVDGTALDYSAFAEFKNGILIPIEPNVTYSDNGFRLQFKQTGTSANASGIGADTSGNNKHFTVTNLNAYDVLPDCPENNFATWNPLFEGGEQSSSIAADSTVSEGALEVSVPTNSYMGSTFRPTSGKWYAEIRVKTIGSTNGEIDWGWIQATTYAGTSGHSGQANKWGVYYHAYSTDHIQLYDETSQLGSNINLTISAGDVLQLAWDIDNNKGWVGINNTYYAADNGTDGNPSAGTNQTFTFTADEAENLQVYIANGTGTDVHVANFGQDSTFGGGETATTNADANGIGAFHHAPPTDFLACCSSNLPELTISPNVATQSTDYFNAFLYAGNDDATRTFDIGFVSDWAWFKADANSYGHQLYDSSRGVTKRLVSNTTAAETTNAEGVLDFDDGGTLLKIGTDAFINEDGTDVIIWNWKANGGTTTTNDASATSIGSQDSVHQANTTAGFSIVTYTGTGSNDTFAHGLGVAPTMIIHKRRDDAQHWVIYHVGIGNTRSVLFNTDAQNSASAVNFNNTSPTSTVFSLGTDAYANASGGTYVAYCFADVEGYSKFGSYTGNGGADGPFIYLGFRPAFIMMKLIDGAGENWHMFDNKRAPINVVKARFIADGNAASNVNDSILDFTSNGWKFRDNNAGYNASGSNYLYMAFAEAPFKYANAR